MLRNWNLGTYALAICLALCAGNASAGTLSPDTWRQAVNQNAATLRSGDYSGALKASDHILAQMVEHLGAGNAEKDILATTLTHKALASAGLGNIDDALWYWYVAQEISPAASKSDLSAFGAPGEYLQRHPFSNSQRSTSDGATPARIIKQVVPSFPSGASRFGVAGDLVVQIVIDKKGQATLPRIVHPLPAPTLSYVALEALRRWQFAPATRNGAPVSITFDLTVHYKL
ncbi:MAG: periplasmic protein TonB [Thermoanaerobaculia bacterium]|jgi:TonB family protein|nr:periplasmic protein TonB [Thermoanaerobaculia bacterium]